MRVVIFCHSLVSDWNHGNAHFLRGIAAELLARGHRVDVLEPADAWSRANLIADAGQPAIDAYTRRFPALTSRRYERATLDLDATLHRADVVLVHEWNDPEVIAAIGAHRERSRDHVLLFWDTHHRAVTAPDQMARLDLTGYDGVLAFGEVIRQLYLERAWSQRAWTWHEAADTRTFHPLAPAADPEELVWIGNWGDDERSRELDEFLLAPARQLGLSGVVHGVRYPPRALIAIESSGLRYGGWLANHEVPAAFARHRLTVHVPRRPYARALPGIPTIRVFEALACGIPLISAPWDDAEGLFRPGTDYLTARTGDEMVLAMRQLLGDPDRARRQAQHGLETILARHTCAHRVDELIAIVGSLRPAAAAHA